MNVLQPLCRLVQWMLTVFWTLGLKPHCYLLVFFQEHLKGIVNDLETSGTFIRVYGANDWEIPIVGVLEAPLRVFGHTVVASLLVKKDDPGPTGAHRARFPLLLGCNVLRKVMSLGNISTEGNPGWEMVYNVLSSDHGNKSSGFPLVTDRVCVVTKPRWETLRPGTVRLMECCWTVLHFRKVPLCMWNGLEKLNSIERCLVTCL